MIIQDATTIDISTHGVCLKTSSHVCGTSVIVGFQYSDEEDRRFVEADVINTEQLPDGNWKYRISFQNPLQEADLLLMGAYDTVDE